MDLVTIFCAVRAQLRINLIGCKTGRYSRFELKPFNFICFSLGTKSSVWYHICVTLDFSKGCTTTLKHKNYTMRFIKDIHKDIQIRFIS